LKKNINKKVQLHMNTTYRRKQKPNRRFKLVMSGIMISTLMLNVLNGESDVATIHAQSTESSHVVNKDLVKGHLEEELLINDLQIVLNLVEKGEFSVQLLDSMNTVLSKIEKYAESNQISQEEKLMDLLDGAEHKLKKSKLSKEKHIIKAENIKKIKSIRKKGNLTSKSLQEKRENSGASSSILDIISSDLGSKDTFSNSSKKKDVTSLDVRYGSHDYGSRTQEQYNKVMEKVDKALEGVEEKSLNKYISMYLDGKRAEDYDKRSRQEMLFTILHERYGTFVENANSDHLEKAVKVANIAGNLAKGKQDDPNNDPRSAYDNLFRGISDCDSDAEVYSAVFDAAGYNTMIVGSPGHANVLIEIDGNWWEIVSGSFILSDLSKLLETEGSYIRTGPTFNQF